MIYCFSDSNTVFGIHSIYSNTVYFYQYTLLNETGNTVQNTLVY